MTVKGDGESRVRGSCARLERRPLPERGSPDLALCLALVHHMSIGGNVPVAELLDWLRSLSAALTIEFPTSEDPMVLRLLARKQPGDHPDQSGLYRRSCPWPVVTHDTNANCT